jgi:hypothetical protein
MSPYDKKIVGEEEEDITRESVTKKPDVEYLFYLQN